MRIGFSDTRDAAREGVTVRHRVILPVYIPRHDGYFEHATEILNLCLESLYATSVNRALVTVVANQCAPPVIGRLLDYQRDGRIDQLIVNAQNHGRIDGTLPVARGAFEELITISDSDVLFRPGWTDAIEQIFETFPECGFASVVPHPGAAWYCTSATIVGALATRELSFERIVPDSDIDRFGWSIGRANWVKPEQRRVQMVVRRHGTAACVGCGHFIFTVAREVMASFPTKPCRHPLGGGTDELWVDRPPDRSGYWRLSTPRGYAFHMGNVPEPWMYDELRIAQATSVAETPITAVDPLLERQRPALSRTPWALRNVFVRALRHSGVHALAAERLHASYATAE
jgi:hypothetical protein